MFLEYSGGGRRGQGYLCRQKLWRQSWRQRCRWRQSWRQQCRWRQSCRWAASSGGKAWWRGQDLREPTEAQPVRNIQSVQSVQFSQSVSRCQDFREPIEAQSVGGKVAAKCCAGGGINAGGGTALAAKLPVAAQLAAKLAAKMPVAARRQSGGKVNPTKPDGGTGSGPVAVHLRE
eukprot:gene10649-biopygen2603